MRLLACHPGPHFSVADLHLGWVEALRAAGVHVVDYPLGDALTFYDSVFVRSGEQEFRKALTAEQATDLARDRLAAALYKVRPDVLLVTSGFMVDTQILDAAQHDGVTVVALMTEQPYELTRELALAEHCDVVLLNDPIHLDRFRQVCTAEYVPHAYRPSVHTPGPALPELVSDFAFVGTCYPSRLKFFERMNLDGLDVLFAGNWQILDDTHPLRRYVSHGLNECMPNTAAVDIYRATKVSINIYRREAQAEHLADGWAMGPREVELAAVGCFYLRDPRPEGDELLPMLPTFATPEDAGEQLRWWLNHPEARETAALKAREAIADRTFDRNAAQLLRLLEKTE
jgi:spore maturation protein CgeB